MTKDDYTVELATLWTLAHQIANIRLEELVQTARESEHTTLADIALLGTMLAVKRQVQAMKGGDAP